MRKGKSTILVSVGQATRQKNQVLLCQRSNFNERAQSAYLLVPIGDGIFYSVLCIVHILHFWPT